MIVRKTLNLKAVLEFAGHHLIWLVVWMSSVTLLYDLTRSKWLTIPWLPLTVIGTAVAFYVGFKNNQSYDRLWEARKIWGAIVNNSRMLAAMAKNFSSNRNHKESEIRRRIVLRHIAYVYVLREQLLEPTDGNTSVSDGGWVPTTAGAKRSLLVIIGKSSTGFRTTNI